MNREKPGNPEKSSILSPEDIGKLKAQFPGLEEADNSLFLEFVDKDGVTRTMHWAKLKGTFGEKDSDIEKSIVRFKKEHGL